ncbi:MAG: tripartite tricarboxylate transporter substrate binding protein [Burkholderiaceae bacterium]
MSRSIRRTLCAATLALPLALAAGGTAFAQAPWPNQPVKLINPFPPGGTVDQISRLLQPHLQQALGQPVVIDTRAGASGSIGTAAAAKSAPDGYTWVMVFDTHGVNPSLIPNLPFDTLKDLQPVMLVGTGAMVLTTHSSQPYKTFPELVAAAKSRAGAVNYGTIGSGSLAHLAMVSMGQQIKVDWTHVPYKGGGPLASDAIAGHVPVSLATYALFAPHIASGRLRPLAVTSPKRIPQLPDVPSVTEHGLPGFAAEAYWGWLGPAGVPADIVRRMNAALATALQQAPVRERLAQMGVQVAASSPDQFGSFLRNEVERWSKVVKEHNIRAGE